jgi:hypothetical protein
MPEVGKVVEAPKTMTNKAITAMNAAWWREMGRRRKMNAARARAAAEQAAVAANQRGVRDSQFGIGSRVHHRDRLAAADFMISWSLWRWIGSFESAAGTECGNAGSGTCSDLRSERTGLGTGPNVRRGGGSGSG